MSIASPSTIVPHAWGWSVENRTLKRTVKGSRQMLRQPTPSWAFDQDLYRQLRPRFDSIEINDRESGFAYTVDAARFDQQARKLDRGFGVQLAVPLTDWRCERRVNTQLALGLELAS